MSTMASSSSSSSAESDEAPSSTVMVPSPTDVLFGRGKGIQSHKGNHYFRRLVQEHKQRYRESQRNNLLKNQIALELYQKIHDIGGRFLKQEKEDEWITVPRLVALEKCKQALREKVVVKEQESLSSFGGLRDGLSSSSSATRQQEPPASLNMVANSMLVLPPPPILSSAARLVLFQDPSWILQQTPFTGFYRPHHIPSSSSSSSSSFRTSAVATLPGTVESDRDDGAATRPSQQQQQSDQPSLSDASDFCLHSILGDPNRPRFSQEQLDEEQANLTETEREAVLVDMFGRSCHIEERPSKRFKRVIDKSLINQMRHELQYSIPPKRKQALMEAQCKCRHDEEFSDERLGRFLQCEGMNAKLAAERFVQYWECRRQVFGEKFTQRMMLSEALREDLVALEKGVCCQLPLVDTSGRQLLLIDASRHSGEGYTSESLLRAYWYVVEVCSRQVDGDFGIIQVAWNKHATVWDYDRKVYDRTVDFDRKCWPVKVIACHSCCPSMFVVRIVKPLVDALVDKELRSRVVIHDVPENELLDVLAGYGILKEMLPTSMGGTLEFSQSEWIANRRAAELEEI